MKEKYATMRAQTEEYSKIGAAQKLVTENNAIQKAQLEAQTQLIKEQSRAEKELVKSGERLVKLKQERKKLDQLEKEGQQTVREEDRKAELEREIRHKQDEFNELAKKVDKYNPDLVKETKRRQNGNSSEIQSARAEGTITAQIRAREAAYQSLEGSIKRQISLEKELARATDTAAKRNTRRQLAEEREKEASIRKQIRDNGYQSAAHDRRVNALSEELGTTRVQARKQRKTRIGFNATMDVYNMAQQGAYAVASAVSALSEVDAAITRVTKVANAPQKDIDAFTKSIYKNASAVGKTAPEYADAVEQWITTGKSLKQSIGLAKDSVMGSFVGNVDVNDMVKYMAVPLNSFRKEGLKSKDIINSMNQVSNKNAIEMEDLGQAYSKASSVVASTGTTFSQLTGMITGAQEATRAGGDVVGRSIKAISLNFSKMSSGVTATDKKRSEFFHGLGVDLKTSDGKMKSTYQIMNDLSKVWGKLSKQQKSDAALYAAGKEHSNQFTGMLDNWKTVQKAMRESQGQVSLVDKDHGSAFQEFEKQQQSVQFHLATLKNSWTQMLNDVVGGREGLNKIVDTGTSVVNVLDSLANNKIFRGTAMFTGAIVAIGAFHKALSGLASAAREVTAAKWDNLTSLLSGETWKNWTADMNERKRQLGIGKKPDRETRHVAERNKMANAVANAADVAEESADIAASRRERYSLNRNKSKIGKRKVKGDLATESRSIGNVAKEVDNLGNVSYRAEGRIGGLSRVGGKVASGMGKMAAAASLVSGVLGPIGVILDGIAIGMTLLELTGAKPFESIRRAINPTKAASDDLNKALDTTAKQVDKIQSGINNNPVFNGAAISVKKSGESLSDAVNNASYDEVANNKLNDENYQKYKDFIKDVNKKYHLHIDVESNNLDVIKDQLKDVLADIKEINNNKIVKGAKDNKKESSKLNDVSSKNKTKQLYEGNDKYVKTRDTDRYNLANKNITQKEYDEDMRNAENAAWMSKDGRKIEAENAAIQKNIRSNIRGMGKSIDSGNFSKDDYKGWDKNTLQQATIATGQILRNRKQEASFLDEINKKQQNGEKLTKGEARRLNDMGISVRKDTSKWTQDERDKFNQARNKNSDDYTRAKQNLDDLLTTRGIGKKRKKEIEDAYESGDNKKYISLMGREGEFGKSMLGLSAMFEAQYGKSWNKVMQSMQGNIDKFNSKNGRTTAASRALVDGDGIVDTSKISQINALGSKNLKNLHIADKDGQVDLSKLLTNLQGVQGSSNPLGLLQDLVSGKADYHQTGRYQSNLDGGKFNSKSKDAKKVFNDYMKNNKGNYDLAKAEMKENGVYQGDIAALDKQGKIYEKARKQLNNGFSSKADKKAMSDLAEAMGSKSMLKDYLKRMGFDSKSANKWVDKNIKKDGSTKKGAVDDDSSSSSSSSNSKRGKGGKGNKGGKGSKNDKKNDKITAPGIIPTVEADELKNTKSMQAANKALKAMKNGQYSALTKKQLAQLKKDDKTAYDNYQKAVKNFNKADKNGDGKLSKSEQKKYEELGKRKAAAENKGKQSENKKNKKKEDKEDTKSNKSSKSKKSNKKDYLDENGKMHKLSDSKGGKLTAKEKRNLQARQKEMERLAKKYNAADKNNDGKLSAKEKRNLAKKLNEEAKIEAQAAKKKSSKSSSKSSSSKAKSNSKQKAIKVPIKGEDKTKDTLNKIKSKGKKSNIKVPIKGEDKTKDTLSKIKSKGKKANIKVPIKGEDKTKGTMDKIKSKGKGQKIKIPVTAEDKTGDGISKIKSKVQNIKAKIPITAEDKTGDTISGIKSKITGVKAQISITAKDDTASTISSIQSSVQGLKAEVTITADDQASSVIDTVKSAIDSIPPKHDTVISVTGAEAAAAAATNVANAVNSIPSEKSVSISVTKSETVTVTKKNPSVGISSSLGILGNVDASYAVNPNPFRSMSVATDNPDVVSAMNGTAANMGIRDYSDASDDTKVNEDYWRYMGKELYKGLPLDEQASKLENAVTQADEDMNKLINIARQKIDVDRKQLAYQNEMRGAYQNQLNDVMGKLRGYGFRTNGNQITNLDIAKNFKGDKASKVDELLSTYQNVYQNLSDVTKKIDELNTDIWQQNKNIQDYQEEIESQAIEKAQRELEMVQRSVEYSKNLADRVIDSLSEKDYAMKLGFSAKEINEQSAGLEKLIGQFNELSAMTFSKKEQAEKIEDSLNDLRQTILDTADSVLELQNNMKQAEIDQYTENLTSFTDTINNNIDRLKSNVQQLQDGLLSGTTFDDLLSSNLAVTDFEQQSALSRQMQQRIDLEKQLDSAMDAFAKKNVDRQNNVAAAQLRVEQNKYAQMLNLAKDYAKGYVGEINTKFATYATPTGQANLNDITIGGGQRSVEYTKAMVKYQDELVKLREEYNKQLKAAANDEQRSRINQKFAVQQMDMQRELYQQIINSNLQAIDDMQKKLKTEDLTTEQRQTLKESIAQYEKDNIDAQNNIKDIIKERFEYENTLIQDQLDKYQKVTDTVSNLVTLAKTLQMQPATQAKLLEQQYKSIEKQYNTYIALANKLREQQSGYGVNSFEWNTLQKQIDEMDSRVNQSIADLLEASRSQFENTMEATSKEFEKSINGGRTADRTKFEDDIWIDGVSKQLKLEQLRQKSIELENEVVKKRIEALDAQSRMSKIQADYVDKQIDVLNAQQALDNTLGKRDTKVLTQGEDGKFNWTYMANQDDVDTARENLTQAKVDMEDYKKQMKSQFVDAVEKVIDGAKTGELNIDEVKTRLQQLQDAYGVGILDDIPEYNAGQLENIIQQYTDYVNRNKDILGKYGDSKAVGSLTGYQEILQGFTDQFKVVGKEISEMFGQQLRDALKLDPNLSPRIPNAPTQTLSMVIQHQTLEFPNVTDPTGFEEAIKNLPQIAKQQVQSKSL
ncbi:Putative phage tail tape measure protein, TP901 family (plasmid) [Ligilactobacillus salivarius]|uniref:Putative phage tail tape measure protein, TP901 family n=1 Tax=Ligilactobacillus salivarius TaxID=1624 RepID=A0A089QLD3_9LACO|nr:Putative phage tail tape measure protein, TP901 family [Ligilactobacillus salivarius]